MRLLDGKPWTHSTATRIVDTLSANGFKGPEAQALEAERLARLDGALRVMLKIQSEQQDDAGHAAR